MATRRVSRPQKDVRAAAARARSPLEALIRRARVAGPEREGRAVHRRIVARRELEAQVRLRLDDLTRGRQREAARRRAVVLLAPLARSERERLEVRVVDVGHAIDVPRVVGFRRVDEL